MADSGVGVLPVSIREMRRRQLGFSCLTLELFCSNVRACRRLAEPASGWEVISACYCHLPPVAAGSRFHDIFGVREVDAKQWAAVATTSDAGPEVFFLEIAQIIDNDTRLSILVNLPLVCAFGV